jgi:hypothetical protein
LGIINSEKYIIEGDEMELVYVWVEKYKNIEKQGFNFSPNHWFEVVPYEGNEPSIEYELVDKTEEKKKNGELREQPDNFFGENISNVNIIVGKNGSGKSTLFEMLLHYKKIIYSFNYIIIFKNKLNGNYYYDFKGINDDKIKNNMEEESRFDYIYYSNIVDIFFDMEDSSTNFLDFSNFFEYFKINKKNDVAYINNQIKNIIITFTNLKSDKFLIKSMNKLIIKVNEYDRYIKFYRTNYKKLNCFKKKLLINISFEYISKFLSSDRLEEKTDEINNIIKKILLAVESSGNDLEKIINETEIYRKEFIGKEVTLESIYETGLKELYEDKNIFYSSNLKTVIFLLKELFEFIDELMDEDNKENIINFSREVIVINLKLEKNIEKLNKFFNISEKYKVNKIYFDFKFDINYSSGEIALMMMYSKFYSNKDVFSKKNYIIFLDEPDIFLHPEWQRNLIKTFVDFINIVFEDKKIKFQIVLTSHSPFIVSDLPRENVIMLDTYNENDIEVLNGQQKIGNCKVVTDKNIKTFGANIFDLYSNAFFVESSFGEFAKIKIKEVVKDLTPDDSGNFKEIDKTRILEIEYLLDSLGEPLVKNKLQKMYDNYKGWKSKELNEDNKNSEDYKKKQLKALQKKLDLTDEQIISLIKNGDK